MLGQVELKGVRGGGDGGHENGSCQCTIESSTNLDAEPGELVPQFGPLEGIGANDGQQGGPHCSRSSWQGSHRLPPYDHVLSGGVGEEEEDK